MKIILASSSPRRIKILNDLGLDFEIVHPRIEEIPEENETPKQFAERCSLDKAKEIEHNHKGLIIAADTIVVLNNRIIGKPRDPEHAFETLKQLSGKKHTVITGITVIDSETGKTITDSESTDVWITKLKDSEIKMYLDTFEPHDKAGAYAAQGKGALLVEKVEGDFFNVVGLPVFKLFQLFKKLDVNMFKLVQQRTSGN